jgi:hypothetical protein
MDELRIVNCELFARFEWICRFSFVFAVILLLLDTRFKTLKQGAFGCLIVTI